MDTDDRIHDTPHNRLVGIIEAHKSQIKTISIDKNNNGDLFHHYLQIFNNNLKNIACDDYGFITQIHDQLSNEYNLELYDPILVSQDCVTVKKLPLIEDDLFPELETQEIDAEIANTAA